MKVDFEDRKYWKTQKCNNLIKSVDLLPKSTSDILCNFVFIFHWDDGVISMNFYPIWLVINARSNLVVIISMDLHPIQLVEFVRSNWVINARSNCAKLGVNPLRLSHLQLNINLLFINSKSNLPSTQGKQWRIPSKEFSVKVVRNSQQAQWRIPSKSSKRSPSEIKILTIYTFLKCVKLCTGRHTNVISVNFHPIWLVFNAWSNLTGGDRIWPPLKLGVNPLRWYPIQPSRHTNVISVNFHPIWPVFNAWLNLTGGDRIWPLPSSNWV